MQQKQVLRELAKEYMEIASLPVQEEKRSLWRKLNAKKPERPMVMIDQVCWNELEADGYLKPRCEDERSRRYETALRRKIYQWRHFPADMVVEPYLEVPMAIDGLHETIIGCDDVGMHIHEEIAYTDRTNDVKGHRFENQLRTDEDLEMIKAAELTLNREKTDAEMAFAQDVFGDILPLRLTGARPAVRMWDLISMLMSVEQAMYALADRPEFVYRIMEKMTDAYACLLDQMEEKGLLASFQTEVHCTGAYTDELPAPGFDPARPRAKDMWTWGLAQLFSCVSARMYEEFDIAFANRLYERFGLVYYGCCDPLDRKMSAVRKVRNLRKVSMSPWVEVERGAAEIASDYVFSRKPNPAFVAMDSWDPGLVEADLRGTIDACRRHGCALEIILKDISTLRYRPEVLTEWEKIAMRLVKA